MAKQLEVIQKKAGEIQAYLTKGKSQFDMVLPPQIPSDRVIRQMVSQIYKIPKLGEVPPNLLALAGLNSCAMGLEPNGRDAHLVPFKNNKTGVMEVTVIPDYKGLIQLAHRSAHKLVISAQAVHQADDFHYSLGTDEHIHHIPSDSDDPGELTHAWAQCRFADGRVVFVVMTKRQVLMRKAASKGASGADSPWNKWPEPMWAKTAVKQLCKWIPQSVEMAHAVEIDNLAEQGKAQIVPGTVEGSIFEPVPEGASKSERLAQEMGAAPEQPSEQSGGEMAHHADLTGFEASLESVETVNRAQKMYDDQIYGHPDLDDHDRDVAKQMLLAAKARLKGK